MAIKIQGLHALNALCGGSSSPDPDFGDGLDGVKAQPKPATSSAVLDKFTIQEKIVPLLRAIKTKEPAVMMAALSVFKQVGKVADADFLALDVLPSLWSFSLGPLLNLDQFQDFMKLIKSLSSKIEREQTRKLSELSSTSATASRGGEQSFGGHAFSNGLGAGQALGNDESDFESLVTGRNRNANNGDLFDGGWGSTVPSNTRTPSSNQSLPRSNVASPILSNGLAPAASQPRAGTVTPDNLGSFTAMTPSQPSSVAASNSWNLPQPQQQSLQSPPLQPSNAAASLYSPPLNNATHTTSTSITWSRANRPTNAMATGVPGIPVLQKPPLSSAGSMPSTFPVVSHPTSSTNPMSVQMPHRSTNTAQQPPKPNQKQGLDKYESLI